mmetsp:Transcript_107766/g.246828  ORF Transcript_107766/g.246828 Transcript_107766/m.246828 type:complete len:105 (-) Transcript_107766:266-580(-)
MSQVLQQGASGVVSAAQQGATSVFQPAFSSANYVQVADTAAYGYAQPQQYLQERTQQAMSGQVMYAPQPTYQAAPVYYQAAPQYVQYAPVEQPTQKGKKRRSCC